VLVGGCGVTGVAVLVGCPGVTGVAVLVGCPGVTGVAVLVGCPGVTGVAVADGPGVDGPAIMSTNTRSDSTVRLWSSLTIAWLETWLPGTALALTRTPIVTVAGAPARALTVQTTVLFACVLHEPFVALELVIVNCGSI
jgi:hypothetical protein